MYVIDTMMAKRVSVETESWLMPELEGDGAVIPGDSGEDIGDSSEDGDVGDSSVDGDVGDSFEDGEVGDSFEDGEAIGVPADGETASILSFNIIFLSI
ncbi:hypothetical protein Bca52824_002853 [Brassica carinata]|uniref:Uncharacterized protein n=1 Tax=Brassica carinata TaxID=52824 RepID=A0A8X8BEN9_BRACI|nr:hypothetical protein Bca52824_002853 [Brassica carinata]